MSETSKEPQISGERIIKDEAIIRHHNTITSPTASNEEKDRATIALGILGRDRGKRKIVNILDELRGKIPEKNIEKNIISE